ncbi:hypothetical protein Rsw2DRAFT_0447 [Rhodobacter ferrooxidans]|uniref:Uncharacterized protein n=1 Tax=Rhodobacter ferrooxidans TaxID=371731 RepID=C8RXB9_9RHOB|nr:hypothetical protein Rsw2DRAFT_0447 [Rhodobacter sp. SW2]
MTPTRQGELQKIAIAFNPWLHCNLRLSSPLDTFELQYGVYATSR